MTGEPPFRETDSGILLYVRLTPKAQADGIDRLVTDDAGQKRLKVKVRAAPEKGAANKALIAILSKGLGVPKSALSLTSGASDRRKTVLIAGGLETLRPLVISFLERLETAR